MKLDITCNFSCGGSEWEKREIVEVKTKEELAVKLAQIGNEFAHENAVDFDQFQEIQIRRM